VTYDDWKRIDRLAKPEEEHFCDGAFCPHDVCLDHFCEKCQEFNRQLSADDDRDRSDFE
jgi:hypothetical protein